LYIFLADPAIDVFIDLDDGSKTAASDAANRFEGETHIFRCFSGPDIENVLDPFPQPRSASDMAGGSKAHRDDISAFRFQAEAAIESPYPVDFTHRYPNLLRKIRERWLG
jgi:hypothetical protein